MLGHARGVQHHAAVVHPLHPGTVPDTSRVMPAAICCLSCCTSDAAMCQWLTGHTVQRPGLIVAALPVQLHLSWPKGIRRLTCRSKRVSRARTSVLLLFTDLGLR